MRRRLMSLVWGPLFALGLAGCPANTSDSSDSDTDSTQAGANAIDIQAAAAPSEIGAGGIVKLSVGVADASAISSLKYEWIQTAGPGVSLRNPKTVQASFTAPSLQTEQTLRFQVKARGSDDKAGESTVEVLIHADPNFGQPNIDADNNNDDNGNGDDDAGNDNGDDNSDDDASSNSRPTAKAGPDQSVQGGVVVTLNGAASTGNQIAYEWKQTAGAKVTLSDPNAAVATFTAPAFVTGGANRLEFKLYVRDRAGKEAGDRIRINILAPGDDGGTTPPPAVARVKFTTTMGTFTVELDGEKAPVTVQNFLQYVDDKFYTGTIFHRVIAGFVVQGGGFLPGMVKKETRDPVKSEAGNGLKNLRGTLAMARTNDPNSATSQFYVNLVDNASLDFTDSNPGYTVFGRVIEGLDVIDQIGAVQTSAQNFFNDVPVTDIVIQNAERVAGP